MLASCMQIADR